MSSTSAVLHSPQIRKISEKLYDSSDEQSSCSETSSSVEIRANVIQRINELTIGKKLFQSLICDDIKTFKKILRNNPTLINYTDWSGTSLLGTALTCQNKKAAIYLLNKMPDGNKEIYKVISEVTYFCSDPRAFILELIITRDLDIYQLLPALLINKDSSYRTTRIDPPHRLAKEIAQVLKVTPSKLHAACEEMSKLEACDYSSKAIHFINTLLDFPENAGLSE